MSTPVEYQRLKERIAALADEWEQADTDHLNTYGQHLPGSVGRMAELLRESLLDEERA